MVNEASDEGFWLPPPSQLFPLRSALDKAPQLSASWSRVNGGTLVPQTMLKRYMPF